jgi:hypothetical protein
VFNSRAGSVRSSPLRSLSTVAPLLLLASVGCHNRKPPDPSAVTPPSAEITQAAAEPEQLFSFERKSDPVSRALVAAYRSYLTAPIDQAEYDRNESALAAARRTLRENGKAATTILRAELRRLDSPTDHDRERHLLLWLLGDAATPEALTTLADVAIAPPKREEFDGAPMIEHAVALAQLGRAAATGNRVAREQILRIVARADRNPDLRRRAIAAYYDVSPSRFRARREVTAVLPLADRYLAHQTF